MTAITTKATVPTAIGVNANQNPSRSTVSGLIAAVIATAPAGGWTARHRIVVVIAPPTATAIRTAGSAINRQAATPIAAATVFPTTADQG